MMQNFIDSETSLKLITAPEKVRDAYIKTGDWVGWWLLFGNPWPSEEALTACFWNTLARLGGDDTDFEWMLAADLCDESDRALFAHSLATI